MANALIRAAFLAQCALFAGTAGAAAQYYQQPAAQPDGPNFTREQMQQGIELSPQQCSAYALTVYVEAQGVGICFRYYISSAGGNAQEAVYWLSGDKSGDSFAYDPATFDRLATNMSRRYRRPAVYLARVGLDGSSGTHLRMRRTWFEVEATYRAIDAINARYGFRIIHVMGQSGGGHLTGALVGLRRDIGCAVPGAGRLAFDQQYQMGQSRRQPALQHYDPSTRIREVAQVSRTTRILVVTDPNDQRVQQHFQSGFVNRVRGLGGVASQFFVRATDQLSHGVTPFTREAMAGCLSGASDAEIHATLQRVNAFVWAHHTAQQSGQRMQNTYQQAVMPFQVPPPGGLATAPVGTMVRPVMAPAMTQPSTMQPPPPPGLAARWQQAQPSYYR